MTPYIPIFILLAIPMSMLMIQKAQAQLWFDADGNITNGVSTTMGVQAGWSKAVSGTVADLMSVSATVANKFNQPTGSTGQYVRGDGSLATFPTIPSSTTKTFNSPARALNTAFQISTTQDAAVTYSVDINCSSPLLAGQSSTVTLQYADNVGMTTNLVNVAQAIGSVGGILNVNNGGSGLLTGIIPAGKYVRIQSSGTCTLTQQRSQEVLF